MKLRTRKFLAGLLSLGLLLQAASPLSALAAETASGAAHTLTVTVGDTTYNLTANGETVSSDVTWPSDYPAVSYADGFVFSGKFDNNTDLLSISGSEDVTIRSTDTYTVKGDLTANVASLTVEKGATTAPAIEGTADITCTGNVSISGNIDYSNIDFVNQSVGKKLTVRSAQNVSIDGILNGGAEITCDTLNLNCGNGSTVRGKLVVNGAREVTATADAYYGVIGDIGATGELVLNNCTGIVKLVDQRTSYDGLIRNGSVTVNSSDNVTYYASTSADGTGKMRVSADACKDDSYKYFEINLGGQAQPTTHTLTLKNAEAYDGGRKLVGTAGEEGTTTYKVEDNKELTIKAVAPDETQQWTFKGWTDREGTNKEITVTVTEDMTLTAKWEKVTDQVTNYGIKVTIGNNLPIEVTSENCGHILGVRNDKLTYNPGNHTLTGEGSFGKMKVEITDDLEDKVDVVLSNANGAVVNGSLTVTGAQDVEVTGTSSSALIDGKTTISCAGDILMENTGTGNVIGTNIATNLAVNSARSVTIKNMGTEGNRSYAIYGRADITCSGNGNVEIVSSNGMAIWDPIVVKDAKDVKIKAAGRAIWDERHDSTIMTKIECSGKVEITSDTAAALHAGNLIIKGATDVTISGNRDDGATIGGDAEIICSGPVVLENTVGGNAVSGVLKYTPDPSTKPYEIKAGTDAADAASKEPVATKEEGGTFSETVAASYISIAAVGTPPVVPGDDDFAGGDSGAGGAVAAVLVGGAAVLGGYEIATRVILHNILPEGAEIPANRGQLALLVWNTAGRPEPVNTPAFADVADADTAKAAQWCVEQGIMDAKSESTFKPEGWMPKFKTIEVWEKAFPKQ